MNLPWQVVNHNWAETSVVDADGIPIVLLSIEDEATEETQDECEKKMADRAAYIVRACNSHEALVAALKRQVANIERWLETGEPASKEESHAIYDQMKAALALAEEKP